ncbi:hypothetical protein PsYK624_170250 [Phanerochaete sordida]|uniref:Uncharacterized protein n=1 Tax=Phanerochaete sordida TaxID=48140 RepID=A0A9P3GYM6_9APHY|nr:hypothetical protein PsYK624_170250 [Phanerochaete sordida]
MRNSRRLNHGPRLVDKTVAGVEAHGCQVFSPPGALPNALIACRGVKQKLTPPSSYAHAPTPAQHAGRPLDDRRRIRVELSPARLFRCRRCADGVTRRHSRTATRCEASQQRRNWALEGIRPSFYARSIRYRKATSPPGRANPNASYPFMSSTPSPSQVRPRTGSSIDCQRKQRRLYPACQAADTHHVTAKSPSSHRQRRAGQLIRRSTRVSAASTQASATNILQPPRRSPAAP